MEGLVFTLAVLVIIGIAAGVLPRLRNKDTLAQSAEPPGDRSAPDDWPRDGGDNPRAP